MEGKLTGLITYYVGTALKKNVIEGEICDGKSRKKT
jgi:hypothetical protein